MPYTIRKNKNKNTFKVTVTATGRVVAYATKDPRKLLQAIEISKRSKTIKRIKTKRKTLKKRSYK
jgi:hypothetical protein